ncbi:MAG TPA: hypothetical protein VJZ76_10080 [Thermoanaerobaculia bacterium]|nr:hypothetical protein [Thermoanaerobaculia bacterium]
MSFRRFAGFLFLLLPILSYAAVDPAHFQDLRWRLIGPFRGGRVLAVTGVPGEPQHFYFGSVNGGVWETIDAGRTWQPIFDGQPVGSIGAIAVAPSDANVIYVGSGEADMRSDIAQGDGMYKSADRGRTWTHVGLTDSQQIGRVVVHPADANVVFVAALGHPYGPNTERGVFRSKDGGKSWQKVLGPDENTGAVDLALEPGNPNVVYASLWATRRTPWSVYPPSTGPGGGIFKSTDGGDHWSALTNGLPKKPGRIGLAVAPSQPQRVYAIVDAEEGGGMYRSDDAGATWTKTSADARVWSRGWYFGGVTVEPKNADAVYSININVYRSDDGGKNFAVIKGAPGGDDYHQLWIDPQSPERRILGVDQGCVVSVDGGKTWSSWYNQPTGQFYHVVTDNRFPYWVYGAQQDSGAAGIPSRTNTIDGINLMQFREITAGGESDNVAPDPKDPAIIYGGRVDRLDTRTMQTQSVDPTLAYPNVDRHTWTLPLVFSYRDPRVLYFANQRLFRTEDGGMHWTVISPDLTRDPSPIPSNLDAATAALTTAPRMGVIYAIAPSRTTNRDLWVGTDDGQVWRTLDEGAHWTNITPPALTAWSKVGIIETSHFEAETAYVAVDRHRLDDFKPYVYRTHDGGKTWQLIASGLTSFVNVVREDSVRSGLLYAGTEKGLAVSFDDGDHWQPLQQNLPVTSVRDIEVHGNDLVIATHGRGFWIMDDVTPLRHSPPPTGADMFPPAPAVRYRAAGFTGTPMPKDEPMAPNPPFGANIDYVLNAPAALVVLEIMDSSGAVVRHWSSDEKPTQVNAAKLTIAPEWVTPPQTLSNAPGHHRFVWSLRYANPTGLEGRRGGEGIWAPPGQYRASLTVDGRNIVVPFEVVPDPRVNLPATAYAEEFQLAREIEAEREKLAVALKDAGAQIPKLEGERRTRAIEISGVDPATAEAWWLFPKSTATLRFAADKLAALQSAVDGADAAPSTDARASFAQLKAMAEEALGRWGAFTKP